jgi:hypothetical protein
MSLFWEETVMKDHPHFQEDLRFLTKRKCDKHRLVYLLHEMSIAAASELLTKVSKEDLRKIRGRLLRGAEAVEELRRSEVASLLPHGSLARCQAYDLRQIASFLGQLEPGFDKRVSRLDRIKAVFVRYVERQTGKPLDKAVVALIDVAQAPSSCVWDDAVGSFVDRDLPEYDWYELEEHSAWRSRHKRLRTQESTFEKGLLLAADGDAKRVADWKRNRPSDA